MAWKGGHECARGRQSHLIFVGLRFAFLLVVFGKIAIFDSLTRLTCSLSRMIGHLQRRKLSISVSYSTDFRSVGQGWQHGESRSSSTNLSFLIESTNTHSRMI